MNSFKRWLVLLFVVGLCLTQSGCALLRLPFQIAGEALKLLKHVPIPPPGVF